MKFFKQYSMSVPCLTKQLDIDEKPLFNRNLYVNPEIIYGLSFNEYKNTPQSIILNDEGVIII